MTASFSLPGRTAGLKEKEKSGLAAFLFYPALNSIDLSAAHRPIGLSPFFPVFFLLPPSPAASLPLGAPAIKGGDPVLRDKAERSPGARIQAQAAGQAARLFGDGLGPHVAAQGQADRVNPRGAGDLRPRAPRRRRRPDPIALRLTPPGLRATPSAARVFLRAEAKWGRFFWGRIRPPPFLPGPGLLADKKARKPCLRLCASGRACGFLFALKQARIVAAAGPSAAPPGAAPCCL